MKKKEIKFEKQYNATLADVWAAWTNPEILKKWWGPKNVFVPECILETHEGGRIYIVMEADEGMGKYQGTRWPLDGTYTKVDEGAYTLSYHARSWTEGDEDGWIDQDTTLALREESGKTTMNLIVTINETGPTANRMAAMGLKMGYKAQFKKLGDLLEGQ
ncbi:MAG: SRPBCC domain-containing protein [Micrococcaceae bacterium]